MNRLGCIFLFACLSPAQVLLRQNPLDVSALSIPDPTKAFLRSSFDPNKTGSDAGNLVRVEPNGAKFNKLDTAWVLFDAAGPGVLTSMWLSGRDKQNKVFLTGQMNFYFDGEKIPSFSAELPMLFESGALLPKPLAERTPNGWVNYAPIFYAKSLKITLTNHGDLYLHRPEPRGETAPVLYYQFAYQKLLVPVHSTQLGQDQFLPWKRPESGEREDHVTEIAADTPSQVLAEWQGRGILNALRLHWLQGEPDDATLTVWCDGRRTVSMKVSELWGVNRKHRPGARFRSLLLGFDDDTYYIYFPMPHRRQLRLQIEQPGAATIQVDTLHQRTWPEREHYYFRAERVQETPQPGKDVILLRSSGAGHYVGAILEINDRIAEGDDRFYVDGEPYPPAWHGTGTDDYFRGVSTTSPPLTRPLYGILGMNAPRVAYRFHLADRLNFTHGAVIGFEHGARNESVGPYRGVVFWYSAN